MATEEEISWETTVSELLGMISNPWDEIQSALCMCLKITNLIYKYGISCKNEPAIFLPSRSEHGARHTAEEPTAAVDINFPTTFFAVEILLSLGHVVRSYVS